MKRSKHNLSHMRLMSGNMGKLMPVALTEVLPGDTVQGSSSALLRVSPLVAPVMHPVNVRIHHWFIPNRILWDGWESFITGGKDGQGDGTVMPTISTNPLADELLGYFGLNTGVNQTISALAVRAYNKIFAEFYADQDLTSYDYETNYDDTLLHNVAWSKDRFTAARPWPQKGGDITIPLGGSGVVQSSVAQGGLNQKNLTSGDALKGLNSATLFQTDTDGNFFLTANLDHAGSTGNVAIDDLRESLALQRYAEARSRYGSRYTEYLAYLGVHALDSRLQRPEYLGGGKQTISFSEVLQTAEGTDPVGEMKGHGIVALKTNRFRKFIPEHGFVMSLMSVVPKNVYMNPTPRHFLKTTKEDYWQRELEHIGQQAIDSREIAPGAPAGLFGYSDRYYEYRSGISDVSGDFKTTLNYWHMARDFAGIPTLNESFVECNPTDRIYADSSDSDKLWMMINNHIVSRRLVSKSAQPRTF